MWLAEIAASGGADLAQTTASWTGAPPSAIGIALGLLSIAGAAVKVMYSGQTKTLEVERERVADLTEALRRRNEAIDGRVAELTEALRKRNEFAEEKLVPALVQSTEAVRAVLKATQRGHRD